jgi:hypothetical protein
MSNFVIAVGGSGAKVLHALIHLSAAGLLPEDRLQLDALMVDPDSSNGNVRETRELFDAYNACKSLALGTTSLFRPTVKLDPNVWTPLKDSSSDTLREIFHYAERAASSNEAQSLEADLLDAMFEQGEQEVTIKQGFRGRPSIGATVLAQCVDFTQPPWKGLKELVKSRGTQGPVHLLLVGSVFGGSGAAGVPTLVRLLEESLRSEVTKLRLGLILLLPFFQFRPVPNEPIQADPSAFPMATAEALKYYHERGFLTFCNSIYALGEEIPADMTISAVGADRQKNEAHFIELVAGMGAMRFFSSLAIKDFSLNVAARKQENTLEWTDLPYSEGHTDPLIRKLQHLCVFAVAYRYIFYPEMRRFLDGAEKSAPPYWRDHVLDAKVKPEDAGKAVEDVHRYVDRFLEWLLQVSNPNRAGFMRGLVDTNVFGVSNGTDWRLKNYTNEFHEKQFGDLLLNRAAKAKIDDRRIRNQASGMRVKDQNAGGPGKLIRALYDSCAVE